MHEIVHERNVDAPMRRLGLGNAVAPDVWGLSTKVHPTLALDLGHTSHVQVTYDVPRTWVTIRVIEVSKAYKGPAVIPLSRHRDYPEVIFPVPCPRADPKAYGPALRSLEAYITSVNTSGVQPAIAIVVATRKQLDSAIVSCDDSIQDNGTDREELSPLLPAAELELAEIQAARKVIIPVAVVLLCRKSGRKVDKGVIASHLHQLVAMWPDGNPPRAALKRVNEYLMSEGRE